MRHWSVTVESSGERLVTIESSHLSGKAELTADDEAMICTAALHLLSFIGKPIGAFQQQPPADEHPLLQMGEDLRPTTMKARKP